MKFYVAEAPDGRTVLSGTQADAKKINKNFTEFDVATDKPGLMEFAQSALDQIFALTGQINSLKHDASINNTGSVQDDDADDNEPLTVPAPPPEAPTAPARVTRDAVVDYVLESASTADCEHIFASIGTRFSEASKRLAAYDDQATGETSPS